MKVLVVDDDPLMRRLVVRLASRHPQVAIREAEHGADALAQIEAERPDLVFTDVEMPYLDGLGLLEAIRASATCPDLPVVAVSAVADKALVLRMVDLGIEGYLLKPLDPASAAARFDEILARVGTASRDEAGGGDRRTLLVVDREAGYGEIVRAALGSQFDVKDDLPAAAALAWAVEHRPAVALVGEGLAMPTAETFARALGNAGGTLVVLLADQPRTDPSPFAARIPRTHVPTTLRTALEPVVAALHEDGQRLPSLLAGLVAAEAGIACRQAVGLITGQESTLLEAPDDAAPRDVAARVVLAREGGGPDVTILLEATAADTTALHGEGMPEPATALLAALLAPIAARAAHVLGSVGFSVAARAPEQLETVPSRDGVAASRTLRTAGGQLLHLRLACSAAVESAG